MPLPTVITLCLSSSSPPPPPPTVLSSSSSSSYPQQEQAAHRPFFYDRASPSVRWPHWHLQKQLKLAESSAIQLKQDGEDPYIRLARLSNLASKNKEESRGEEDEEEGEDGEEEGNLGSCEPQSERGSVVEEEAAHKLPPRSDYGLSLGRKKWGKMSRLALLKATDWRERVQRLSEAVCELPVTHSVADLLNKWPEQLAPTDYCLVVKQVGYTHWARSLELFEWLNMKYWYTPNNRMLSAILGVLGRAGQVNLAEEVFQRVEPELGDCVQVYNAMLSVHARGGNWERMQILLKMMLEKGCERDLITYNTLISGRAKAGLQPGMAMELLREIWQAGLRPDTVTYNTLISTSSLNKCYEDAVLIYEEMKEQRCQADVWTYNSMISVYGRCGLDEAAEEVYRSMKENGFPPDAITYNSILFAYAKKGRVEDVDVVRKQMKEAGCHEDVITYNTIIDMYGKKNLYEKALAIYEEMKAGTRKPDIVTFVVLIDGLGKAGQVQQAEIVFEEMVEANFKPSLNVFCAMICAYAKARAYEKAVDTYQDMMRTGIRLDGLAYSVMLDVFLNLGQARKALSIYKSMTPKYQPGLVQCELMLQSFKREGLNTEIQELSDCMHQFGFNPAELCRSFATFGLCDAAGKAFKTAVARGQMIDISTRDLLLNAFIRSHRHEDARSLVRSVAVPSFEGFLEQLVVILANAEKFDEAREELENLRLVCTTVSVKVFRAFIVAYELADMCKEAVQMLQEMQDLGLLPDTVCCRSGLLAYCRLGNPDPGHVLLKRISLELGGVKDPTLHLALVKAYIKLQQWKKCEIIFTDLKETGVRLSLKDYNALLLAYAHRGQAQQVQRLVKQMVEAGLTPSSRSVNVLLEALLSAGRLVEIDNMYQTVRELGVKPDLQTCILMVNAYAKHGNVEKAKGLYEDLKNGGYVLHVEVYNVLIGMFSKAGCVEDAECIMKDMKESGFQPNIFCYNAMLSVYGKVRSFKKAAQVFQGMQSAGCAPDKVTYNTLIHMYSRCLHTQEAFSLLQQMKQAGCRPDLSSYTMLITAYGLMQMWEAAGALFKDIQKSGIEIDESTYHLMIDIYRRAGRPELSQDIVTQMKEKGFEPTTATMHMLLDSYGKGGQTGGAAAVFDSMVEAGVDVSVSHYTSLIDAYLKECDYDAAVSKLKMMESEGITANFVTWTCVIAAASKCEQRQDVLVLLRALHDIGFALPLKLLTAIDSAVLLELECLLQSLLDGRAGAGPGLVNVILDLLWAFHKRATAADVFNLAIEKNIYEREFSRVKGGDWGADFCKLSPGGALVALNLWLIRMQEAALQGSPIPSKSVVLVVGSSKRSNHISLNKTVKSHLWEMGAPFLLSKTREGALVAKGHSVGMWLKDSPKCFDLDLEDRPIPPELNSMQLYEGAWMPREMVPVFKQIEETMGSTVQPKKFMRLANMHDEKRADVIATDIKGRAEKLARDKLRKQKVKQTLPVRKSLPSVQ